MVIEVMPEVLLSLLTINRYEINLVVKEGAPDIVDYDYNRRGDRSCVVNSCYPCHLEDPMV